MQDIIDEIKKKKYKDELINKKENQEEDKVVEKLHEAIEIPTNLKKITINIVKGDLSDSIVLKIKPHKSIKYLKKKISKSKFDIAIESQKIRFGGKTLDDS